MSIAKNCNCGKVQPYCNGECLNSLMTKFGNVDISELMVKIKGCTMEQDEKFQKAFYEREMKYERTIWKDVIGTVFNHEGELDYELIIDELMSKYHVEKA